MKLKYYLRGIGVGILFSTIILSVVFQSSSKNTFTDEEIIKRAQELGMEQKEDSNINLNDLLTTVTPTEVPSIDQGVQPTIEPTPSSTKEPLSEETTIELDKEEAEVAAEAEVVEQETVTDGKIIRVEIVSGMTSEQVSILLKEKGIIEDSHSFNQYLKQNDYTKDINIGEFEIEIYTSYREIANIIIGN